MFEPDDPTDGPFLDRLRGSRHSVYIAFKHDFGLCQIEDVQHIHKDGHDRWSVRLRITESDFTPTMEMGMQGLSADDIAERRARRILLDENPFVEGTGSRAKMFNEATLEVFIRGVNARFQPKGSPFRAWYDRFGGQPDKFLDVAWILGVLLLKSTGVVAEVTKLELTLSETRLHVSFAGKRRRQYTNKPATEFIVDGLCDLSKNRPARS
jgi:hypothetical protein